MPMVFMAVFFFVLRGVLGQGDTACCAGSRYPWFNPDSLMCDDALSLILTIVVGQKAHGINLAML
jgi:hypothetical protein